MLQPAFPCERIVTRLFAVASFLSYALDELLYALDELFHREVVAAARALSPSPHLFNQPLTDEVVRAADAVITMGCGDACPIYPGKRYEDWQVDDPASQSMDDVRRIRDDIDSRVLRLLADLVPDKQPSAQQCAVGAVLQQEATWLAAACSARRPGKQE